MCFWFETGRGFPNAQIITNYYKILQIYYKINNSNIKQPTFTTLLIITKQLQNIINLSQILQNKYYHSFIYASVKP